MAEPHFDDHLDPTAEISLDTIKHRTVKGVTALVGRFGVLYLIAAIAQGFLGAFLTTEQWGVFAVVSAAVNFLVYFSDIGLAASLIQNKDKLTDEDLKTTFTIQQGMVLALLTIIFLVSSKLKSFYGLGGDAMTLLYALAFSLLLSSLKTIPSVLLERKIEFEKIALASVLENLSYYVVLVFAAWQGMGVQSFTYAVLTRGFVGLVVLYILQPWKPGLAFSKKSLKRLLGFGVPYQVNTIIALVKDDGIALILGKILGLEAMGLLVWAQKWAQFPLRIFMDSVTKVTFPAFARLQDKKTELENSVTKSIFFITFMVFPMVLGLFLLAPMLVKIIPRYSQWEKALIPLGFVMVNTLFAAVATQLTNLFNAIGKIKITFKLMLMWAGLTIAFVPYLSVHYGVNGAAVGYALVGASSIIPIIIAKHYVNFSLINSFGKNLLAALIMAAVMIVVRGHLATSITSVITLGFMGALVYGASVYTLYGKAVIKDAEKITKSFLGK